MSNTKVSAAKCEICGGKLILRNEDSFECESCGANYPKDWVRAKVQEISGKVRIEGPVQVEGLQSADQLALNAETFIQLNKFDKALDLFHKIQAEYPHDYRGWWGAVRIRSNEFTNLFLEGHDYASIIGDGKSAIKVAELTLSVELESKLNEYISEVYKVKFAKQTEELQNKIISDEDDLANERAVRDIKHQLYLEAESAYAKAKIAYSQSEENINKSEKTSKNVSTILNVIAGGWALFLFIELIKEFSFDFLIGFILFGLVIPFGIVNFISNFSASDVRDEKIAAETLRSDEREKSHELAQAKSIYNAACDDVRTRENDIQKCNAILSELQKDHDIDFMSKYISGVIRFYT